MSSPPPTAFTPGAAVRWPQLSQWEPLQACTQLGPIPQSPAPPGGVSQGPALGRGGMLHACACMHKHALVAFCTNPAFLSPCQTCLYNSRPLFLTEGILKGNAKSPREKILAHSDKGFLGNACSTGLAMQSREDARRGQDPPPPDQRMLCAALGVVALLGLAGSWVPPAAADGCAAPHDAVSRMLQRLEGSAGVDEPPDPSVLLALNLAGAADSSSCKLLLQQLKEAAVERAPKDMTSGELALYTLAFLSSCQSPRQVQALGHTVDLLRLLQEKTDKEVAYLEVEDTPQTTFYQVSLDVLALCLEGTGSYEVAAVILAKEVLSPQSGLSVDTRAVAALALTCAYGQAAAAGLSEVRDLLRDAVTEVANTFLDEQEQGNGLIGNIYSMGLALQALTATAAFYAPREWDCAQAFSVVLQHQFQQPVAIAQVLPALLGRTYLDAAGLDCAAAAAAATTATAAATAATSTTRSPARGRTARADRASLITVYYSVVNELRGAHFNYTTRVQVPAGSVLLAVLRAAQEQDPARFSFQTEATSWGAMVVSIHGLAASAADKTYWRLLSGKDALDQGVDAYEPRDGEHIQAVFSTY
ncbi:cobalamin binding intrinsic factor isoform X2 [Struthio camelus]|uniref:cobalamin binding intrinsic factor isoform X2 n=2 Tax=Struthio camelus TaxID=8801 RepID=UPI003603B77B